MNRPHRIPHLRTLLIAAAAGLLGCSNQEPAQPPPKVKYQAVDKRPVPKFMEGTLYELTNLENDSPFLVSAYGLVVHLDGTGGSSQMSNNVKAFMSKEMEKNGFGSKLLPGYEKVPPEVILQDKNAAVVAVYGYIPPGARKGQFFDVGVRAEALDTTSLARGLLFTTNLAIDGANRNNPSRRVNVWAQAYGPVFVNPAVALKGVDPADKATQRTLRTGLVIGGARTTNDRPLLLRLRQPERRLARSIETRVNEYYHQDKVCTAYDEGYCQLWVPETYGGDWQHFAKLVSHLYVSGGNEAFARAKARELVEEAAKPDAPLQDISYCWEGLGKAALPSLAPILADPNAPANVRFAAARAAAYVGDSSGAAEQVLFDLARARGGTFQLPAVQVLGQIPNTRAVNYLLRQLLDAEEASVRTEAYSILARNGDPSVQSRVVTSVSDADNQKFVLDFVESHGQPLIYATLSGIPRIAIFGQMPELSLPVTFGAMDNHLMISSNPVGRTVTIYYRHPGSPTRDNVLPRPVMMSSHPDLDELLMRLAGATDDGVGQFDFTYAEILAILQGLTDQQKLRVTGPTGREVAAALLLQEPPTVRDAIDSAPTLDRGRPQGEPGGLSPKADSGATAPEATSDATTDATRAAALMSR